MRCSGECRGAQAAKARYKRKVERLRQMGKSPHRLDDWRNTSYVCSCQSEYDTFVYIYVYSPSPCMQAVNTESPGSLPPWCHLREYE